MEIASNFVHPNEVTLKNNFSQFHGVDRSLVLQSNPVEFSRKLLHYGFLFLHAASALVQDDGNSSPTGEYLLGKAVSLLVFSLL